MQLSEDRIDWIANAHCPSGTAHPSQVKNAIREALAEALRAQADARPVLWWNGIRKGEAGDFVGPSFSEKEDTNHDIPLVSAVNPCNIAPVDMMLHCPNCGLQHIDKPDDLPLGMPHLPPNAWHNPPHRSHLCAGCGHIWRPADVPTNGVLAVKTKGQNDSPITGPDRVDDTHPEASAPGLSPDAIEKCRIEACDIGTLHKGAAHRFAELLLTRASAATATPSSVRKALQYALSELGKPPFGGVVDCTPIVQALVDTGGIDIGASAATVAEPSELEMHRADYQAIRAAGFHDPGELLDAYKKLQSVQQQADPVPRKFTNADELIADLKQAEPVPRHNPRKIKLDDDEKAEPGADEMAAFESWAYRKILHSASEAWQVWRAAWRAAQSGQRAGVAEAKDERD